MLTQAPHTWHTWQAEELQQIDDSFSPEPSLFEQLIRAEHQHQDQSTQNQILHPPRDVRVSWRCRRRMMALPRRRRHAKPRLQPMVSKNEDDMLGSDDEGRTKSHTSQPMRGDSEPETEERKSHGCNCKRMKCDKKYCSCFKNGNSCGKACQCKSCANPHKSRKIVKMAKFILEPFWEFKWQTIQ